MSDFEAAFTRTVTNEGGYDNNPRDKGGETYKGISRNNWPKWTGWPLIDSIRDTLVKPPTHGTREWRNWAAYFNGLLAANSGIQQRVRDFYRKNFWGRLGDINDQRLAEETFDKSVNTGTGTAVKWLQRACGAEPDGVIGPRTITIVNGCHPPTALRDFNRQAEAYYRNIARLNPSQSVFLHGWLNRLKNYDDSPFVANR